MVNKDAFMRIGISNVKTFSKKKPSQEIRLDSDEFASIIAAYARIAKNYNSAIREIKTKLEVLDDDFELTHEHNPIHFMASRVKSIESIIEKAQRRGFPLTAEGITENMMDIAGIRVVCHYIEDIYTIAELLKSQTDISILQEKDYIKEPKPNGYRSLHLIVKVPVFFADGAQEIPVEVQIRTMAMDFWASLEHKIRYKSDGEIPKFIADELSECAQAITDSDLKMQKIYSFLEDIGEHFAMDARLQEQSAAQSEAQEAKHAQMDAEVSHKVS